MKKQQPTKTKKLATKPVTEVVLKFTPEEIQALMKQVVEFNLPVKTFLLLDLKIRESNEGN